MRIRLFSYSMELRDLIYTIAFIYLGVILTNKLGLVRFVALALTIYGALLTMRCFLFWLCDEGPMLNRPVKDTIISFTFFITGLSFLLLWQETFMPTIRFFIYWLLIHVVCRSGERNEPFGLILVVAFFFYDIMINRPIFPYPEGKVTWPWTKKPSKKSQNAH